jgi:osmotically-inducible protein OsmY
MTIMMKTDAEIQRDVMEEFEWDPEIDVTDVGVEVDNGVVTLTGTVKHYATKLAAERAAFRVLGVRAVANDVVVHWSDDEERTDTEIANAAANVVQYNTTIPEGSVDIKVSRHWVTLSGEVPWEFQRRAAEKAIKRIHGVAGVANMITIMQPAASVSDIREGIERALVRSAEVDADRINVHVDGGHVTLTGSVRSWVERQEAHEAAWKSRGVTSVSNKIEIRNP